MATTLNMSLYSLTIQLPTAITQAIVGQFSGTKEQQITAASGSCLTILRPDPSLHKVITLVLHDVFGIIRFIASFRLVGSTKDYIILATDSSRIAIIEYLPAENRFSSIHLETFGKSGGRACLIASVEKNKLVYVFNRNAQAELTVSSPLEAHNHGVLVFSLVALDVGYANPVFAALETNYSESDQDASGQAYQEVGIQLVYHELDLGLNHIVRKWSVPTDRTSTLLFQVPGGNDGPSGVLVCGEESITHRHSNEEAFRVPISRRQGATEDPQWKRIIVSGAVHMLKGSTSAFFFLLQTEDGALFKVTLDIQEVSNGDSGITREVKCIKIKYFDTIPVANSLCILKSGFLFAACEFGNHHFYQFEKLADTNDELEFTSDDFLNCKVVNPIGDDTPHIYSVCGGGSRSTFRILKHGLEVNELVASELPETPLAVWTTKFTSKDEYDSYIVLAFSNNTMVLSIGETITQVNDSREREVYKKLNSITTSHARSKCVRMLLDSFDITTGTGSHICMVHKPPGLRISDFQALIPGGKLPQDILKLTLRHMLLALEFLYSECNLAHTDIQAKNILMGIDDENVLTEFEEAEVRNPSPCKVDGDRVIYSSRQLPVRGSAGRPVLCDFGEARIGGGKFTEDIQPFLYRAPEVILRKPWDKKVDIWKLGVLVWDLSQSKHLFDTRNADNETTNIVHLAEMIALLGIPPKSFLEGSPIAGDYFNKSGHWVGDVKIPSNSLEECEENLKGKEKALFLQFMRKMLQWDPEGRMSAMIF